MTGADHYRAAEQLQQHARAVMEATQGPFAEISPDERARLRADDLADAQVHALLALAAVFGLSADLPFPDATAWREAAAGSVA